MNPRPEARPTAPKRKRILVVDDDPDVGRVVVKVLQSHGYDGRAVGNPLEVLQVTSEFSPDLIILDYEMPELQGSELSVLLKSRPETGKIPIVFLSGMVDEDHHVVGRFSGAAAYLDKPVNEAQLIETIRSLIKNAEAR